MRLLLSRQKIAVAARSWERQYGESTDTRKQAITAALNAMDMATATATEVAAVIGNKSWSHYNCDECSLDVEKAVEIGDEYTERKLILCPSCARAVAALASVAIP